MRFVTNPIISTTTSRAEPAGINFTSSDSGTHNLKSVPGEWRAYVLQTVWRLP